MDYGLTILAVFLFLYAISSKRLGLTIFTGPLLFASLGWLIGPEGLEIIEVDADPELLTLLLEATLVLVEEPPPGAGGCEVVVERSLAARTDTGGVMPPASGVAVSRLSLPKEFTPATSPPRRGSTKIITSRARRLTRSAWP